MRFIRPIDLPVTSPFGMRGDPPSMHSGIDFSDGRAGHPIRACADGTVTFNAFEGDGLGNTVTLQHDGIKSGYGHMREPSPLQVGEVVRQGDVVGFVGDTPGPPFSRGNHLHFWMGQNPNTLAVDPAPLLAGIEGDEDLTPDQARKLDALFNTVVLNFGGPTVKDDTNWMRAYMGGVPGVFPDVVTRIKESIEVPASDQLDADEVAANIVGALGPDFAQKVADALNGRLNA